MKIMFLDDYNLNFNLGVYVFGSYIVFENIRAVMKGECIKLMLSMKM